MPVIETPEHIEAAKHAFREENAPFLTAVMEGRYTDAYLVREGANAPKVESGDMKAIGSPLDFVGLNVYQPDYVRADSSPAGYSIQRKPASFPHMASPWLFLGPEVIYWAVRSASELWKPAAIYITENGCSADDRRDEAGRIEDIDRVMFLRNYLTHLHRARPSIIRSRATFFGVCSTISNGRTGTKSASVFTTSISKRGSGFPS